MLGGFFDSTCHICLHHVPQIWVGAEGGLPHAQRLQAEKESSRRESLAGVLAATMAAATLAAQPAQAVLGIGEGTTKEDEYKEYTVRPSLLHSQSNLDSER